MPVVGLNWIQDVELLTLNDSSVPGCELLTSTLRTTGVTDPAGASAMIVPGLARITGVVDALTFNVTGMLNVPLVVVTVMLPL
jgi:hypothetical protein